MDKVIVCGHRVLIRPEFDEDEIKEGPLKGFKMDVGETFKREKALTIIGEVLGVGATAWKAFDGNLPEWKPWAKIGDIVYFARRAGSYITVNEETLILLNDEDIQAVLTRGEDNG